MQKPLPSGRHGEEAERSVICISKDTNVGGGKLPVTLSVVNILGILVDGWRNAN